MTIDEVKEFIGNDLDKLRLMITNSRECSLTYKSYEKDDVEPKIGDLHSELTSISIYAYRGINGTIVIKQEKTYIKEVHSPNSYSLTTEIVDNKEYTPSNFFKSDLYNEIIERFKDGLERIRHLDMYGKVTFDDSPDNLVVIKWIPVMTHNGYNDYIWDIKRVLSVSLQKIRM